MALKNTGNPSLDSPVKKSKENTMDGENSPLRTTRRESDEDARDKENEHKSTDYKFLPLHFISMCEIFWSGDSSLYLVGTELGDVFLEYVF